MFKDWRWATQYVPTGEDTHVLELVIRRLDSLPVIEPDLYRFSDEELFTARRHAAYSPQTATAVLLRDAFVLNMFRTGSYCCKPVNVQSIIQSVRTGAAPRSLIKVNYELRIEFTLLIEEKHIQMCRVSDRLYVTLPRKTALAINASMLAVR